MLGDKMTICSRPVASNESMAMVRVVLKKVLWPREPVLRYTWLVHGIGASRMYIYVYLDFRYFYSSDSEPEYKIYAMTGVGLLVPGDLVARGSA